MSQISEYCNQGFGNLIFLGNAKTFRTGPTTTFQNWRSPSEPWTNDFATTSWGCWIHSFGIPGVRPMFLKPKLYKESKNGFKTINYRRSPVMIFSKNCFWSKKIIKKVARFADFWIFMAICMDELDQFKKINYRTFRIS